MTRRILVAVLAALLCVVVAPPASAATGTYLRLAHLSPDTPRMDVLVTSFAGQTSELKGVGYGDVSTYKLIEPGTYSVQMRLAGAPASSPAVVGGTLEARAGAAYTAAGLGPRSGLSVNVLADDLTPPAAGQARVRVIQGTEQAGNVDIRWNGAPTVDGVAFGTATGYVSVPAGAGTFTVAPATGADVPVPVTLADRGVYSVIVVQRDGRVAANLQTDAAGPGEVPTGGIETGMGGTADDSGPGAWLPAALVAGLLGIGLVGVGVVRRAR